MVSSKGLRGFPRGLYYPRSKLAFLKAPEGDADTQQAGGGLALAQHAPARYPEAGLNDATLPAAMTRANMEHLIDDQGTMAAGAARKLSGAAPRC